jgi:hypothetical protein
MLMELSKRLHLFLLKFELFTGLNTTMFCRPFLHFFQTKLREHHIRTLEAVKMLRNDLNPQTVMLDFEQAEIKYIGYQELKMKHFTRVCRIEPQAVGAWLKQTSVKSNFQHVVYTIFFR